MAHEIDFKIFGNEMQYVEIELDPNESVVAEAGGMMMMDHGIKMDTILGDGSDSENVKGFFNKLGGATKRAFTGESLFMTVFTNEGVGKQHVSFASPYPGKIIPINLAQFQGKVICQKDAFLCAAKGVSVGMEFTKRFGVGLFGGDGFVLQKLEGDGMAFIHAGGTIATKQLAPGETIRIDTGCLVAMTRDVDYNIEFVKGFKNAVFGGEGIVLATLTGPGLVMIQSLPFSKLASRVIASAPQTGSKSVDSGSVIGGLSNLFES